MPPGYTYFGGHSPTSQSSSGDTSSDGEEDEGGSVDLVRRGPVQVISEAVVLDDEDAVVVLVLPRGRGFGGGPGAVDPEEIVQDPIGEASKIFLWKGATDKGLGALPREPSASCTQRCYQQAVREKLLSTVVSMGLNPVTFESIDGDEVYLKLGIERDGPVLKHLATCFRYKLPLTRAAYRHMERSYAGHPPGRPPKNREGDEVFAYHEYNERLNSKLQPFRDVDMIRLVTQVLEEHMSFAELQRQQVISRFYPAAKHHKVLELHAKWVLLNKWCCRRTSQDDDAVRDYFGEEVAFFFQYYAYYIHMLFWLAMCAIGLVCVETKIFKMGFVMHGYCKLGFGVILSFWASAIEVGFEKKAARTRQRWGMEWSTKFADRTLQDYRAELEGTWRLVFQQVLSYGLVICACLVFSSIWGYMSFRLHGSREAVATSVLIRVAAFCWSYVVPHLARLHNHRTLRRKNKSMTVQLAVFKLFVYLSPFLRTAFVTEWTQKTCAPDLRQAADRSFAEIGWPAGVQPEDYEEWLQDFIIPQWLTNSSATCIWGCKPHVCRTDEAGRTRCRTTCYFTLGTSLDLIYVTHTGCSVVFLLIAIIYARCKVRLEMASAADEHREYTFLQFQAKCHEVTPYEYLSWGGSYVEDFLEVVLGFALLCCFGMVRPQVVIVVLLLQILEYRLLAYRMTHVTARPYPTGSQGIDMWMRIIHVICVMSVLITAALAVFLLPAFNGWEQTPKLLLFLTYSLVILGIRCCVQSVTRKRPTDVSRIEDYNFEVMTQVSRNEAHTDLRSSGYWPVGRIDVGLVPGHAAPAGFPGSPDCKGGRPRSFSLL